MAPSPDTLISLIDLTTLSATDHAARVEALCARALHPADGAPPTAAVCVFPTWVPTARRALPEAGPVQLACVAGAFPHGQMPLHLRLAEVRWCVEQGADEIDMVIRRDKALAADEAFLQDEIAAHKAAAGAAHLKVILETGELVEPERVRWVSDLAIASGADFLKTSTGKGALATHDQGRAMLEAIAAHHASTGQRVGFKPAGGMKTTADARAWFDLVGEVCGADWQTPALLRLGASSLLDALLNDR